jgi:dihydrofolate reductase
MPNDASNAATANRASDPEVLRSWIGARVASGDLQKEIRQLKQEPGNYILAHGGAGFASSLAANRLIDEYRLLIHPVALGSGLPLFGNLPEPLHMHLAESIDFGSGIIARVYQPI